MIESIKKKLWDFLKEKQVLLVMLFDSEGRILWHKGRGIMGKQIGEGEGFSKTHIIEVLHKSRILQEKNIVVSSHGENLPQSARILNIKSLFIQPLGNEMFLYIDSGNKEYFTESETEVFKMMGELLSETIAKIKIKENHMEGICGESEVIKKVKKLVVKYAVEEDPIFILGENGSGKSHIAKLIHEYSGRSGPFVIVNTPSIPDNLLENEIFGCQKGGHSEAKEDKPGLVEIAHGGTIFFDEIAEISINLQAKLLQFIETKTFRRLGDLHDRVVDVRILAATNKNIKHEIKNKQFRQDLFYRLNVLSLEIPPLRKRKKDIRLFVDIYKDLLNGKYLTDDFWDYVNHYNWPGNIRELRSVMRRAGLSVDGDSIGKEISEIIDTMENINESEMDLDFETIQKKIENGESFFDNVWRMFLNRDINRKEITSFLRKIYNRNNGSLKKTASYLNIQDKYHLFVKYLHAYDIHPGT